MLTQTSLFLLTFAPAIVSAGLLPRWMPVVTLGRRTDICGVNGYDRDRGNYFWSASKPLASYSGCSAQCARSKRCESFGFNDEVCMLFDLSLAENFDEDRQSDVKYFDVGCIQKDTPPFPSGGNGSSSLNVTLTTTVSTETRTITRSIALATGTGGPLQPANCTTGFFPVHRTGTAHRHPHTPTITSIAETDTSAPTPTADAAATETAAADSSDFPELNPDSSDGTPQNATSATVVSGTDTE